MSGIHETYSAEKLTKTERLILSNQYRILEIIDSEAKAHWERSREAVERGYEFEYDRYCEISDPLPESECRMVVEILDMCWLLQRRLVELDDLPEMTNLYWIQNVGFDGNNETRYVGYARFLVDSLGLFKGIVSDDHFNSHTPTLRIYEGLLAKYNTERKSNRPIKPLTTEAIKRILE